MSDTSGPPYPRYAPGFTPGDNAIGTFSIGVSPIGILSAYDEWLTVMVEYANSPIVTSMIESFNAAIDQTQNMSNLFDMIWNVLTAQGYGLDVWGRIVGVSRTLQFPGATSFLGFNEATGWTGFGQGGFFSGGSTTTNFDLSDTDFRRLILAKASGNISDGSIRSVNKILLALFPLRGACYVVDNQNMSLTYKFQFPLSAVELAIIQQSGVLPSAAGVAITISQL
jgi:Protein of unknown function (DUF2612)